MPITFDFSRARVVPSRCPDTSLPNRSEAVWPARFLFPSSTTQWRKQNNTAWWCVPVSGAPLPARVGRRSVYRRPAAHQGASRLAAIWLVRSRRQSSNGWASGTRWGQKQHLQPVRRLDQLLDPIRDVPTASPRSDGSAVDLLRCRRWESSCREESHIAGPVRRIGLGPHRRARRHNGRCRETAADLGDCRIGRRNRQAACAGTMTFDRGAAGLDGYPALTV
jgi:hypothetical protein